MNLKQTRLVEFLIFWGGGVVSQQRVTGRVGICVMKHRDGRRIQYLFQPSARLKIGVFRDPHRSCMCLDYGGGARQAQKKLH